MTGLLAPAIWTVVVALTLWPPFRRGRPGFAVYVLTMTINELPLVFILVTAAGAWLGAGARPGGAAGVAWWAMWAFVIGGLVWVQARAGRARTALERAFAAGLGEGWRSSLRADLADLPSPSTPWIRGMLLPFQRGLPGVERVRDVPYGPDPAHLLDVYHGPAGPGPRPVLLHFHEGGFVQGRKSRESVTLLNQLASHGWLCLSANYRLREEGAWPHPLVDAKRAIAWAREHAADHGADPGEIYLVGGSAGGHIALNAALTSGQGRFQPGFEDADTSVRAAVSLYGYLGARSADRASNPSELAGPDSPPMLLIQGGNDTGLFQPVSTARAWARSLRTSSGAPVVSAELPGTQHAFDLFASVRARTCADFIESFLAWARSLDDDRRG